MSEREELFDRAENQYWEEWRRNCGDEAAAREHAFKIIADSQPPAPVQVTEAKALEWLRAAKVSPGLERALVYQQWKDGIDIDVPTADLMSLFRVALEAALQAGVPSGWKLVPEEPTKAMRQAFHKANDEYENGNGGTSPDMQWAAMLAAAPAPGEGR